MSLKANAKKIIKRILPPVTLKNMRGLTEAVTSYYPEYVFGKGKTGTLKHVYIEVTFRCNCRCQMCPLYGVQTGGGKEILGYSRENEEMKLEEYKKLFEDLRDLGTQSVNLTGGEVFIRKDITEIIKYAKDSGFDVSITSNGGVITREIAKDIVRLGVNSITISLDGPKEVHENIRKAKIFDRIMDVADWIAEEKEKQGKTAPSVGFLCTVSGLNQRHLTSLVEVVNKKGLELAIDPIIFTSEDDWKRTQESFSDEFDKKESFVMPDTIGKVDTDLLEVELKKAFARARELNQPLYISIQGKDERKKFFSDPGYSVARKCFMPWYSCRIDPFGKVYPCSLSMTMGNLRENSIKEIVNGEKFVNFRKKLKAKSLLPFCSKCCFLYSHNKFWNILPKL